MPHIEPFLSLHLLHAKDRFPLFRDGLSQCFGNPPQGSPWTSCLLRSSSRIGLARASFSTLAPRDAGMPRNLVTRMFLWFLPSSSGSHHKVCATFPALGALQCWNKTCIDGTRHFSDPSQIRAFAVELSWQLSSTVCVFIETFSTSPGQFLMNSRGDAFCGAASASPVCCGRMVLLAASSSALSGARNVDVSERFCMPRDRFPTECFGDKVSHIVVALDRTHFETARPPWILQPRGVLHHVFYATMFGLWRSGSVAFASITNTTCHTAPELALTLTPLNTDTNFP